MRKPEVCYILQERRWMQWPQKTLLAWRTTTENWQRSSATDSRLVQRCAQWNGFPLKHRFLLSSITKFPLFLERELMVSGTRDSAVP